MKFCKHCGTYKDLSEFGLNKNKKDGLDNYCKSCRSSYFKGRNYDRKEYQSKYKRKITDERREYQKTIKKTIKKNIKEYVP